ncbi:MAG: RNA polymerase sigma factor [Petrimonas sp.]|nr:RNA polymerase sigma factor [Petrimonas sp.]
MNNDKFHQVILPLKDKLYRLALSIVRDETEAEDIVQDVLLKLWSKRNEWNDIENMEAYCYRSIKNLSFDRLTYNSLRKTDNIEPDKEHLAFVDNITPHLEFVQQEQRSIIYKCIDELSDNQKLVFQLREVEGMSYRNIAETLEISEELVKISLFRARKKLKELLEKYNNDGI